MELDVDRINKVYLNIDDELARPEDVAFLIIHLHGFFQENCILKDRLMELQREHSGCGMEMELSEILENLRKELGLEKCDGRKK